MLNATMPKPSEVTQGAKLENRATGKFAPRVEFTKSGQQIVGLYTDREKFIGQGKKEATSHRFGLIAVDDGVEFVLNDADKQDPTPGLIVALTGKLVDDSLTPADIGRKVVITYEGEGKKKKGRNPAKLYRVQIVAQ